MKNNGWFDKFVAECVKGVIFCNIIIRHLFQTILLYTVDMCMYSAAAFLTRENLMSQNKQEKIKNIG